MSKNQQIRVQGYNISYLKDSDYVSLTDLSKNFSENPEKAIENWMRNKDTIEFLWLWENLNNENFKPLEFEEFKNQAGTNRFLMSPTKWIKSTNAIGIKAKSWRFFGGTFAHKDIALEFASWIHPWLRLYIIKEFQRLKEEEAERLATGWDTKRTLAKVNYRIHTDAIKEHLTWPFWLKKWVYSTEADMLNKIIFGKTAKEWLSENPDKKWENQRDYATAEELIVLANLEYHNSHLLNSGIKEQEKRAEILYNEAQRQFANLLNNPTVKKLK